MTTEDIIKIGLQATGILISGGVFIWARKKYSHFRDNRIAVRAVQNEILNKVLLDIKDIKHQVNPNGGHSLNDKVGKISDHLGEIDKTLVSMKLRQRNSSEILDVANWESDKDGRVEYVSTALCDLIGRTSASLMDYKWTAYLHPDDRDRVVKAWTDSIKSAGDFNCIYRYIKSDGNLQRVNGKAIHNTDEHGIVMNSLGRLIKLD